MTRHTDLITKAQKVSQAVYLACEQPVADDISKTIRDLRDALNAAEEKLAALQAPHGEELVERVADSIDMYFDKAIPDFEGDVYNRNFVIGVARAALSVIPAQQWAEGWKAGREAAVVVCEANVMGKDSNNPFIVIHNQCIRRIVDSIRALPIPHGEAK